MPAWLQQYPDTDIQQLRALIRQARKDAPDAHSAQVAQSTGQAPRKSRAYRELFQLVRTAMAAAQRQADDTQPPVDEE